MFVDIAADSILRHVLAVKAANGNRMALIRSINSEREKPMTDSQVKATHERVRERLELAINGGTVKTKAVIEGKTVESVKTYEPLPAGEALSIAESMLAIMDTVHFPTGKRGKSAGLNTSEDVAAKLAGSALAKAFLADI